MNQEPITIYDVLLMLANGIMWKTETDALRVRDAIAKAQENELFNTEGRMQL